MSSILRFTRFIVCTLLLSATAQASAASAELDTVEPRYPPRTIIMLVASWCAPCRGELSRMGDIAAAAGGRPVRVFAIDDSAATARMLRLVDPALVWRPDATPRIRAALLARTAGLPYAAATDARGAICAEEHGGLDAARTVALVRRCTPP